MKPYKVIVLDILYKHAHLTSEFYVTTLNTKVCFSLAVMARIMKPSIEIVLDMLYKHAH